MEFGLNQNTILKINSVFKNFPSVSKVFIYGSRAKGNFKKGSDIDLTIESSDLSYSDLLKIENEIDDLLLPYSIDLSIKNKIENKELLDHIDRVGLLFYVKQ